VRRLFRDLAEDLADRVLRGEFDDTGVLPAEHDLAADYAVARGTVRNALGLLRDRRVLTARAGSRWRVRTTSLGHDAGALESFGQLARARGHEPGGRVVAVEERPATVRERRLFRAAHDERVLHVVRVRSLDGVDVMLERTAYAPWVAAVIRTTPTPRSSGSGPERRSCRCAGPAPPRTAARSRRATTGTSPAPCRSGSGRRPQRHRHRHR